MEPSRHPSEEPRVFKMIYAHCSPLSWLITPTLCLLVRLKIGDTAPTRLYQETLIAKCTLTLREGREINSTILLVYRSITTHSKQTTPLRLGSAMREGQALRSHSLAKLRYRA